MFRPALLSGDIALELLGRSAYRTIVLTGKTVLESIFKAAVDQHQEIGGILLGTAHAFPNSDYLLTHVKRSAIGKGSEGSPVHLRFTSESWDAIGTELSDTSDIIVGWFHTHPSLGVFMSGTDRRTQKSFFSRPWQVSLVVDPKSEEFGFFAGEDSEHVHHILLRD